MSKLRGRLIVFEGGEGVGKTTQIKALHDWLLGSHWFPVLQRCSTSSPLLLTREPGGSPLGLRLRQLLLDSALVPDDPIQDRAELLLYAADRGQHVAAVLEPALKQGRIILCDRFTASTVAYQGYGRGLDLALIEQLNAIATQGLTSDLTLWLDVAVEVGLQRARRHTQRLNAMQGADRMEAADVAFHQRVRQGFADQQRQNPQQFVRVDASGPVEAVQQQIQDIVQQHLTQWYPQPSLT